MRGLAPTQSKAKRSAPRRHDPSGGHTPPRGPGHQAPSADDRRGGQADRLPKAPTSQRTVTMGSDEVGAAARRPLVLLDEGPNAAAVMVPSEKLPAHADLVARQHDTPEPFVV